MTPFQFTRKFRRLNNLVRAALSRKDERTAELLHARMLDLVRGSKLQTSQIFKSINRTITIN